MTPPDPAFMLIIAAIAAVVLFFALRSFRRRPPQKAIVETQGEDAFCDIREEAASPTQSTATQATPNGNR